MGKRRKGRCAKKNQQVQNTEPDHLLKAPHSFVLHRGLLGGHVSELAKDFRRVMEPFTASSLKERKRNSIKDFVSIAGVFHVSHLCIFSRSEQGVYLKLCRLPRGPTLTFKVHNFSLSRDVLSSLKKQSVFEELFKHSPLIVMNNLTGEGMQMRLMASMFQNMFPSLNLRTINLSDMRRCVLVNYNKDTKLIDFRHYGIKVLPVGVSKGVKKMIQGKVPDLSKCDDISELITKSGLLSESEFEDDSTNQVVLSQKLSTRGNLESEQSAIRLSEIGPRLTLQLIKVEDGLLDGEVLYHELVVKTEEERAEIARKRQAKMKLKADRKKTQELNAKKKEMTKQEHKEKSLKGMKKKSVKFNEENIEQVQDNDAQYYREEVGAEPDKDLFPERNTDNNRKRKMSVPMRYKPKKKKADERKTKETGKFNKFNKKNQKRRF